MNHQSYLAIGTLLLRPKFLAIIQPQGVVVGHNAVLHNTPDKGEHVSTFGEFASGQPVHASASEADPCEVTNRARQVLSNPRPYDLFARNCQHTASALIRGVAKSPWIAMGVILVLVIVGIWVVSKILRNN